MRYWIFKVASEDWEKEEIKELLNIAFNNNYCFSQYEYNFQNNSSVTTNWNMMKQVSVNDVIFLRAGDKIYAWGYAVKPRFENEELEKVQLSCDEMISTSHQNFKYRSDNYRGYIEFKDCDCFYENLEDGKNRWGQRIDVDNWNNYVEDGIIFHKNIVMGSYFPVLGEITEENALEIVRQLVGDNNFFFKR